MGHGTMVYQVGANPAPNRERRDMSEDLQQRFVVVAEDDRGRILAVHANTGYNGNADNYTYKTMAGALRKQAKAKVEGMVQSAVFEIKYDDEEGDEVAASHRAERAAKRVWRNTL